MALFKTGYIKTILLYILVNNAHAKMFCCTDDYREISNQQVVFSFSKQFETLTAVLKNYVTYLYGF